MTKSKSKSKKSEKNKDASSAPVVGDIKPSSVGSELTPVSPSPVNVIPKNVPKVWFQNEIQSMMYAFGDSRRPSPDSATLIEEIVHQQMSSVIIRAAEVTNMRGGRFMSMEDILFLMRRDKDKLKRLIKYLTFKDLKNKTQKQTSNDDDDVLDVAATSELKGSKRRKISYDFLSTIDHTGDLVSLFDDDDHDEVKQERNERADRLSRTLDHQQYMDYIECRQANFNKKAGKFKEWIDCGSLIDMKPNAPVMEIFSYLAYETVAQVVDLALLVKKDADGGDMLTVSMPPVSSLSQIQTLLSTSSATPMCTSTTPNHTPPSTPTTPTTCSSALPFLPSPTHSTSSTQSAPSTSSKSKSKKRKSKSSSSALQEISSDCIQPWHIREALRKFSYYIGPMAPYSWRGLGTTTLITSLHPPLVPQGDH
ncbi:hypothetical protein QZH41_011346, partial [Actinostola sp. cb2023]